MITDFCVVFTEAVITKKELCEEEGLSLVFFRKKRNLKTLQTLETSQLLGKCYGM